MWNDTVSLFTCISDDNDNGVILKSVLKGVSFQAHKGYKTSTDGRNTSSSTTLLIGSRLNSSDSYIPEKQYLALSFSDKLKAFTVMPGQIVVRGNIDLPEGIQFKDILSKYDDAYTVVGLEEYQTFYPHIEVYCE